MGSIALSQTITKVQKTAPVNTSLETHSSEDLKLFHMGQIEFNKMDFKSSTELLKRNYFILCKETSNTPLPLEIKIENSVSKHNLTLTLGGTFEQILDQLCAIHDMHFEQEDTTFTCSPFSQPVTDSKQTVTTSLRVPPSTSNKQTLNLLANTNNVTMTWDDPRSTITLSGKQTAVSYIKRIAERMFTIRTFSKSVQYKILTKTVSFKHGSVTLSAPIKQLLEKEILNEGETQILLREVSKSENAKITAYPSILSRFNEEAKIEIIKNAPREQGTIGHTIQSSIILKGMSMHLKSKLNYHSITGMKFAELDNFPVIKPGESVQINKYDYPMEGVARDGYTHLFKLNISESNTEDWILMKTYLLDASGNRITN